MTSEEIHEKLIELIQESQPLGDFEYLLYQVVLTERARIERAVLAMRADYPEDIFSSDAGKFARMLMDRVLGIVREDASE